MLATLFLAALVALAAAHPSIEPTKASDKEESTYKQPLLQSETNAVAWPDIPTNPLGFCHAVYLGNTIIGPPPETAIMMGVSSVMIPRPDGHPPPLNVTWCAEECATFPMPTGKCIFFNSYMSNYNGVPTEQVCHMWNNVWPVEDSTYDRGDGQVTYGPSYTLISDTLVPC
ncbi:hypothetical protein Micbo1qcDRAFT_209884 [Microdochium bolleyi]|uniref:Apple domain-containing protein n=1 Tax=Microdochium bolleyi TaxID=196109 RepID=A0A136IKS7_9PEZI|nr:hypothetical protein Micbo1qcDRAFT_209884 [Microdochium bolleyi]